MKPSSLTNSFLRVAALCWTALVLALPFARAVDAATPPTIWAFNMRGSNTINLGETVEFNWSVSHNTEQVTLEPGVGVVTDTWARVQPEATTTYTLTARNSAGAVTKSRKITVIVPPVITSFEATPAGIAAGQSAKLTWSAPGATYYYLSADVGNDPGRFFKTSATVRPGATTTYTLTAFNSAGSTKRTLTLPVGATGAKPAVSSFTATPASVLRGGSTTLEWSVNGADTLSISPGVGPVTGSSVTIVPDATTTYTLTAANAHGTTTGTVDVTVSPRPVPPPEIVLLTATPELVTRGQSTTLAWHTTGADRVTISGVGDVAASGTVAVSPLTDTTYILTASNTTGSVVRSVTVAVAEPTPVIRSFTATPASIAPGGSATLDWSVSDAAHVYLSGLGEVTGSSLTVTPAATTAYTLTATNANGSISTTSSVTVTVTAPAPAIHSFTATPAVIERGGSTTLSWSVENGEVVSIAGLGVVTGNSVSVSPASTTTYTLTASNSAGAVSASTLVTVNLPPPYIQAFQVSPESILQGESAELTWFVDGATRISISGLGEVTGNSATVTPAQTTSYLLTAANDGGSVTRAVTLTVNTPEPAAVIRSFTATPATVALGDSTTLAWDVTGAASVAITASAGPSPGVVTGSSLTVSPAVDTTYTLTATNNTGIVTISSLAVKVTAPLPVINSFTATPASIAPGASSTLNWSVTGATHLTVMADAGTSPGNVTGTSLAVTPAQTTTYTLTATNEGGSVTRTVVVMVADQPPVIGSFVAWPNVIDYGQSTKLYWDVRGAVSLVVTAERGDNPGTVTGATGSVSVTPVVSTLYTMVATSAGGATSRSVTQVTVNAAPPPPVPVIDAFSVTPSTINRGDSAMLNWTVTGADSLSISPGIGAVTGTSVTVNPTQTTTYTLTATNQYGPVTRQITLNVTQPAPPTISAFTANPGTIPAGGSTTLNWTVADATELSITADVGASPGAVTGASLGVSPAGNTTYTLHARNNYGEVTRTVAVAVTGPTAPVIDAFTANPAFIQAGATATLVWSVSGASEVSVTADVGASPGVVAGTSVTVTPGASTAYTLHARNTIGETTATATVTLYTPGNGGAVAHPRIWITPARVAQLAQRAGAGTAAWIALRDRCDALVNMTVLWPDEEPRSPGVPADPDGYIWGGYQYIDYLLPATELGLGYQVAQTVDPVRAARYAAKAKEIALKLSDPVRHGRESTDSGYSVRVYVPTLALIYDWVYDQFQPQERAQIYTEINRWITWYDAHGFARDFPNGNYFAGYYCGKALGALATEGDNPAATAMWDDWLNRLHYGMVAPYHAAWLSGGGAPDGWNYGPFEVINMMRPIAAAFTAKGLDLLHGSQPFTWADGHARWMTHFTWPDLKSVNDRGFLYNSDNPSSVSAAWATEYTGLLRLTGGANTPVAQQYLLDLRARPGTDRAFAWTEFLYFEPAAPVQDYRTDLSYRTVGDGQVAMRSAWSPDAVFAAFQSGPYTGSHYSGEQFYDQGALTIQRGNVGFVVNAWGALLRNTPGTDDGGTRRNPPTGQTPFEELFSEMYGSAGDTQDGTTQPRRLFNTFYAPNPFRAGMFGFFSQVGNYSDTARTTLSRFEDAGRHVLMRGSRLEDMYWMPEPILGWERTVVYVRPQVFVVYDRTRMTSGSIDHWMSWSVLNRPEAVSLTPEAAVYDVIDRRPEVGGQLYRGRLSALLPVGRVVDPVNLFNRNKVFRMDIRAVSPGTDTNWLTVFDASASAAAAGTATPLTAAAGTVLAGAVEGTVITGTGAPNAAVLFSQTGATVAGPIHLRLPAADTYCVVNDLAPGAGYTVTSTVAAGQLSVQITPGGERLASAQGTLSFDVSAATIPAN